MRKKQIEYGLTGLGIGAVLGILIGFAELNWIKKSQRSTVAPVAISITVILCAASGYGIGSKLGRTAYIEERLGLDTATDNYYKAGRFWHATTKWTDRRDNKEYLLYTARSNQKILVSALVEQIIIQHDCESASKETVPKYHTHAKAHVFNKLKEKFTEEPVQDMYALLIS